MNNRNPHIHTLSVVTILFCFLFADILNAQDRPYHDHRDHRDRQSQRDMDDQRDEPVLGLRVGANYANVWDESDQEFEADGVFGPAGGVFLSMPLGPYIDRKSTRLNSSHVAISYAVFCLQKKQR